MTTPEAPPDTPPDPWDDAMAAAAILALDPAGIGGVALRAPPGPVRDRWLAALAAMAPVRKVPLGVSDDRLRGGLDLAATLAAGARRWTTGLLEEGRGGVLALAMAERVPPGTAAQIGQAMEGGFGILLLDEGIADERPPACLLERAGIHLDLSAQRLRHADPLDLAGPRDRLPHVAVEDAAIEALCAAAAALGVASGRAPLLALHVARAAAALDGRDAVSPGDVALAARLVLAPRATALPAEPEAPAEPPPDPPPEPDSESTDGKALADQVLDAAVAAIPAGLLASLQSGVPTRSRAAGRVGAAVRGARGRAVGARAGLPRDGARLDLMATLRAAAPWQRARGADGPPIRLRRDDLRISRREQRTETVTIFLVDASGSSALNRLAEAKGAVELLLADCYVRRDQVAVLAFRGQSATLLLPPTRSLVRAKRGLAGLPGGGGTPLSHALEAGAALAEATRRRGATPTLVLLTDGQANVGRDGKGGRAQAQADATAAARQLRAAGHAALLIDTSPRPNPASRMLAMAMGGKYLALPFADAASVSRSVRAL